MVLARADSFTILVSPDTSVELLTVIHRPELASRLSRASSISALERAIGFLSLAVVVRPSEEIAICRDPNDDKFFSCAVAGEADYIVSEDKDVLATSNYRGIRTITAAQFIELFESQ